MGTKYNRVMFVTNSLSGGGAERATNILVNALSDSGTEVTLVAINDGPQDLIKHTCEVIELKRQWQGGLWTVLRAYFALQIAIWRWKPRFLVLNCDIPELLGSLTIGRHKLIAVEHATYPWINRFQLGKIVRQILAIRETKWVAVSSHLSIWGTKSIPDISICNAVIVPNLKSNITNGPIKRLNYVGRLSEEKQPIWAFEIAKLTNLPLRIFGDGLLKTQLQNFVTENDLEVEFAGFVSNPWAFFSSGDLLLVPSRFEGDGLVLVEALGSHIPLISNDIPDLQRFNLPHLNYASDVNSFSNRINENLESIEMLVAPKNLVDEILSDRDPTKVANRWNVFLTSIG